MAKRRRVVRDNLDADDDIVFEVLRYAYCGTVHFPKGLLARLGQLLGTAEHLGVDLTAEPGSAETTGALVSQGLLEEPGVQRWLRGLPTTDLISALQDNSLGLSQHIRVTLLMVLSKLRPKDFSVEALTEQGRSCEELLNLHPGLVHLSVHSMAGAIVIQRTADCSMTIAEVKLGIYVAAWAEDTKILLVHGGLVLEDSIALKELGASGNGCSVNLGMVRQALKLKYCLCRQVAVRLVARREGPNQGRAFLRCSGLRGSQCPFFEWTE